MKRIFTKTLSLSTLLFLAFSIQLNAQELHEITVQNNFFDPSSLSITQGDTVRWTNVQGNHNVNGTASDYPNNPEEFGNDVGSGWTYEYVFNVAGFYEYHCDPHVSLGMTGDITVSGGVSISEVESASEIVQGIYPQPAQDYVYLELNNELLSSDTELLIQIFNINGALVKSIEITPFDDILMNTNDLTSGTFIFHILSDGQQIDIGKLIKI